MVPQAAAEPGTMTARPPGEPNVQQQLANDRTLLAWVRTAIALAGLGFVVARFGLFLRELSGGPRWPALVTGLLCFTAILVVAIYLLTGVR
jgi:uncharacterized membrane protein YidH (DUF202 family)